MAYALLLEQQEDQEGRNALELLVMSPGTPGVGVQERELTGDPAEDYVPPWWQGDDAAYIEAQQFQGWLAARVGK